MNATGPRSRTHNIEHFRPVDDPESPVDHVIDQVRDLLAQGVLKPGTRLPSERVLAEKLDVSRGYVRQALQRLAIHGILEVHPQRGLFIAPLNPEMIGHLITHLWRRDGYEARELMDARSVLEVKAAVLAAQNVDMEDINTLEYRHRRFVKSFSTGADALEEDHLFHLSIAQASGNRVLESLISWLTPEIIALNRDFRESPQEKYRDTPGEHRAIIDALKEHDADAAAGAMQKHMDHSQRRRLGAEAVT